MQRPINSDPVDKQLRRVVVRESGHGPCSQVCVARRHTFCADKPETAGELLMTNLAACTAMTLWMSVQRKQFNVERITVTVEQDQASDGRSVFRRFIEVVP